jgi:hypothetical protein
MQVQRKTKGNLFQGSRLQTEILNRINWIRIRNAFYNETVDVVENGYVRGIEESGCALF